MCGEKEMALRPKTNNNCHFCHCKGSAVLVRIQTVFTVTLAVWLAELDPNAGLQKHQVKVKTVLLQTLPKLQK